MFINNIDEIFMSIYDRGETFLTQYNKDKIVEEIRNSNKGLLFRTDKVDINAYNKIKKALTELKDLGIQFEDKLIGIDLPTDHPYFKTKDCVDLCEFEKYLNNINAQLVVAAEDLFTVDDILKTNSKLDDEINYINSLTVPHEKGRKLNQMEKFLMVYDYCTYFKYHENYDNKALSRNITSILNSRDIVCVGYASLMKEMCDRLGIECYTCSSDIYNKKDDQYLGGHQNNMVVLDGKIYYADACWDSKRDIDKGLKLYNYCLIPVQDKNYFKRNKVKYTSRNTFKNIKNDMSRAKQSIESLKNNIEIEETKDFLMEFHDLTKDINLEKEFQFDITKPYAEQYKLKENQEKIDKLKFISQHLQKYEYGEAISAEKFEDALINIYLAKGMNQKSAQNLLQRTIEVNVNRSKKIFDENATNCFACDFQKEYGM